MRALPAYELLNVREQGAAHPMSQRVLMLLAAAYPDTTAEVLAGFSMGQRDACLLELRERTFGPRIVAVAACPGCTERLELDFKTADILVKPVSEPADRLLVDVSGYKVRFRVPNSLDMQFVAESKDLTTGRHLLIDRCIESAWHMDEETSADQLPVGVIDAVSERMAQADPQCDIKLALSCPSCGRQWEAIFDIASFFWKEIESWAYRILREVHILASAYGWREVDILAMSPRRRRLYLEMVDG